MIPHFQASRKPESPINRTPQSWFVFSPLPAPRSPLVERTLDNAITNRLRSASVWARVNVSRSRQAPSGTVGGLMAGA